MKLQDQITAVETELATRESELVQERQLKEDLFQQASASAQNQNSERRLFLRNQVIYLYNLFISLLIVYFLEKLRDEKFHKLKELYTKLREEHIQLLRQVS